MRMSSDVKKYMSFPSGENSTWANSRSSPSGHLIVSVTAFGAAASEGDR